MYGVICLLLFGSVHICSDLVLFEDHVSFSRSFYGVRYGNVSGSKIVFIRFDQRNIPRLILGLILKHKVLANELFRTSFALFSI